jgi:hypothetical protein
MFAAARDSARADVGQRRRLAHERIDRCYFVTLASFLVPAMTAPLPGLSPSEHGFSLAKNTIPDGGLETLIFQ